MKGFVLKDRLELKDPYLDKKTDQIYISYIFFSVLTLALIWIKSYFKIDSYFLPILIGIICSLIFVTYFLFYKKNLFIADKFNKIVLSLIQDEIEVCSEHNQNVQNKIARNIFKLHNVRFPNEFSDDDFIENFELSRINYIDFENEILASFKKINKLNYILKDINRKHYKRHILFCTIFKPTTFYLNKKYFSLLSPYASFKD